GLAGEMVVDQVSANRLQEASRTRAAIDPGQARCTRVRADARHWAALHPRDAASSDAAQLPAYMRRSCGGCKGINNMLRRYPLINRVVSARSDVAQNSNVDSMYVQPDRPGFRPMTSAIAYLRVSTAQQGRSGLGIEAQREAVRRFAEAEGFNIIGER